METDQLIPADTEPTPTTERTSSACAQRWHSERGMGHGGCLGDKDGKRTQHRHFNITNIRMVERDESATGKKTYMLCVVASQGTQRSRKHESPLVEHWIVGFNIYTKRQMVQRDLRQWSSNVPRGKQATSTVQKSLLDHPTCGSSLSTPCEQRLHLEFP